MSGLNVVRSCLARRGAVCSRPVRASPFRLEDDVFSATVWTSVAVIILSTPNSKVSGTTLTTKGKRVLTALCPADAAIGADDIKAYAAFFLLRSG